MSMPIYNNKWMDDHDDKNIKLYDELLKDTVYTNSYLQAPYKITAKSYYMDDNLKKDMQDYMDVYMKTVMDTLIKNQSQPTCITGSYAVQGYNQHNPTMASSPTSVPVGAVTFKSVTERYPISHNAYNQLKYNALNPCSDLPDEIHELYNNVPSVREYIKRLPTTNEIFIAKLEDVRPRAGDISDKMKKLGISVGNTLDPWFRNISSNRDKFVMHDSENFLWIGEHQYQIKVGANHEEIIVFWGIKSSIETKPIYIILYTIMKMGYIPKTKKRAHLELIGPYNCSVADDYNII